jgi:hypothetical protein
VRPPISSAKEKDKAANLTRNPAIAQTLECDTCAGKLAQFFPQAARIRIPVRVKILRPGAVQLHEDTIVEFGATDHAIFASNLPLEFDDRVQLTPIQQMPSRERAGKPTDATVIAVQYHDGRRAVAVRFLAGRCNWVTDP